MQFTTGIVRDGKIDLGGDDILPEGARVWILLKEEEPVALDPEEEAEILRGMEEADRGELHDWEDVLADIRRR